MSRKLLTSVRLYNENRSLDINTTIIEDINGKNFINIHMKRKIGNRYLSFFKWKNLDYCEILNRIHKDEILKIFKVLVIETFINKCPVEKVSYHLLYFTFHNTYSQLLIEI